MKFEEQCKETLAEAIYPALIETGAVDLSTDGYGRALRIAAALIDSEHVNIEGWLEPDGTTGHSFSEQLPMVDGQRLLLSFAGRIGTRSASRRGR